MAFRAPLPLKDVVSRLRRVVEHSPCDLTELVWVEIVHTAVSDYSAEEVPAHVEATVLVRVREGGRIGAYQTVPGTPGELTGAVRQALGQSRVQTPASWRSPPAPSSEHLDAPGALVDPELATLDPEEAHRRLVDPLEDGERARLCWAVGRIVLANSLGLEQQAAATCATLEVARGDGAGRAAASARSLESLGLERVMERARWRGGGEAGAADATGDSAPRQPVPVVLAPEAAISWLALVNHHALSSRSFRHSTSCLRGLLGQTVTAPGVRLVDDGTREPGLPFPFDLYGWAKKPVTLIGDGVFRTPAVDRRLEESLGLPPTPHAVAFTDSRPSHLFLEPEEGEAPPLDELLEAADGGLWISALERPECFDAAHGRFRARAAGVRRIEDGRPGARLPDLLWEDTLTDSLEAVAGLGGDAVSLAQEDGFRGGITAPAVALEAVRLIRPRT